MSGPASTLENSDPPTPGAYQPPPDPGMVQNTLQGISDWMYDFPNREPPDRGDFIDTFLNGVNNTFMDWQHRYYGEKNQENP